jgi:hypothetical protein
MAQTTLVTATVTDPNGLPYAGASLKAQLTVPGATVTINNAQQCASAGQGSAPCKIPIQGTAGPMTLDPAGNIPGGGVTMFDNAFINPGGTQWIFTVSIAPGVPPPFGTGPQTFSATITITGGSQSITAALNAAAPKLTNSATGIGGTAAANQIAVGTASNTLGGSSSFLYNLQNGVQTIASPGLAFAAPTVTPANAGATTWGYTIVARQATVDIATSAQGTTATGTAALSGVNNNLVAWIAVPGATAYDVFLSTGPGAPTPGYIATVNAPTVSYTDTGTPTTNGQSFLTPPETGFISLNSGFHGGNMSWSDVLNVAGDILLTPGQFMMDSPVSELFKETATPASHGSLAPSADFTAGNFWAWGHGTGRAPVGLNALAIGDSNPGPTNGINGIVGSAINNSAGTTQNWEIGITGSATNNSTGNSILNLGFYGSTTNNAVLIGSINTQADFYGDVFAGNKSANIGKYATFYSHQGSHSNAGAATLTAAFYSEDTGTGAADWSFYSAGGNNFFGAGQTFISPASQALPGIVFNEAGANGLWSAGNGNVNVVSNSQDVFNFNNSQIRVQNTLPFGFASGNPSATGLDAAFSRDAPKFIDVGNGTALDRSGILFDGNKIFVANDFTDSTSTTLLLITGLSWTLPANSAVNVSFHCALLFDQATAAVSDSFGIGITGTAPTQANASGTVFTSASAETTGTLTALASTTPTAVVTFTPSAITTVWKAELDGTVEQPSNATPGVLGIYVATTAGADNIIVKRGSYCSLF